MNSNAINASESTSNQDKPLSPIEKKGVYHILNCIVLIQIGNVYFISTLELRVSLDLKNSFILDWFRLIS